MQFWNTVGMGSLSGMLSGAGRSLTSQAQLASLDARIGVGQFAEAQGSPFEGSSALMGKAPPFPGSAMDRLRNLMFSHMAAREDGANELANKLLLMKEQFFESHSLETMIGENGKPQVVLDEHGKPRIMEGRENPPQQVARQEYEAAAKDNLNEKHASEKESFLKDEKQQIQTFLQTHRSDLGNPAVQAELQKMILLTQKKALKLQKDHDEESWKVDLPTEEMKAFVDEEGQKLRHMEDEQKNIEDASQDARELIMYQEEVNTLAKEERENQHTKERDEVFLKGPSAFLKPPPPPSLSEALPPYLTEALYNMGIYSVD
jgi:hypothetical protein